MANKTVCVIGAGPSGLAAAKAAQDMGLATTVYEGSQGVGGNWRFSEDTGHSSVFETTHIISSKRLSRYHDFPMPADYPEYPSHAQLLAYFERYAQTFQLTPLIQFGTRVTRCEPDPKGGWLVSTERTLGEAIQNQKHFDALMVANGHHWKPRWPEYEGTFSGEFLHSHQFKRAEPFRNKRVLVIGGGNSAADIAVECSRVSMHSDISWRRGYWIVPKFVLGQPSDVTNQKLHWVPIGLRRWMSEKLLYLLNGPNEAIGLPAPDHRLYESHPLLNSELYYCVRHGKVKPHGDVKRFDGRTVYFADGSQGEFDVVICATGYWIAHPFFDAQLLDYSKGPVPLYLRMVPDTTHQNLFFIGLFQPLGCIWPAAELQAKIAARAIAGVWHPPGALLDLIGQEQRHPDVTQVNSPRHSITVADVEFRRRLYCQLPGDIVPLEMLT
jgi:hypothetical protein